MDIKYFELMAANKDSKEKFTDIAKNEYKGTPIFEHACNYVNNSDSYKRSGRQLELLKINDYSITVKLTSESPLEMASKSLVGFTRELLRIDKEMHPDEEEQIFRFLLYNNTLFRNTMIDAGDIEIYRKDELSDVEALKKCVDLFCNNMTVSKAESVKASAVKSEIKKLLVEYERFHRLGSYESKMKEAKR